MGMMVGIRGFRGKSAGMGTCCGNTAGTEIPFPAQTSNSDRVTLTGITRERGGVDLYNLHVMVWLDACQLFNTVCRITGNYFIDRIMCPCATVHY